MSAPLRARARADAAAQARTDLETAKTRKRREQDRLIESASRPEVDVYAIFADRDRVGF